jgi:phosphate-selective porin OprO and OprP
MSPIRATAALMFVAAVLPGAGWADTTTAPPSPESCGWFPGFRPSDGTAWDQALAVPTIYKDKSNPWVQELAVVGQLQLQYAYGSDDSGKFGSGDFPDGSCWGDTEVRRLRVGMKGRLFEKLTFLNLTDLNPEFSPRIYKRTPETYFTYAHSPALNISAGKTELKFDREQEYSSRDFLPFERSAVGNMLYGGELTGAWVCGSGIRGGWLYFFGVYENDRQDELPAFEGGAMILGKIGYDYTSRTTFDLAEAKVQWLHNTEPGYAESATHPASPSYSNSVSISNQLTEGDFGLTTEFLWGDGAEGRPDVCQLSAMSTYRINEQLQIVSTFEAASSREENGVFLPARYESLSPGVGDKSGDAYFAAYAGLNWYLHGNNLKWMSGVKYSYLDGGSGGGDFNGWTLLAGMRMAF